ncbi:unnamed protein product, partial [Symbiodinium sp. KB8]
AVPETAVADAWDAFDALEASTVAADRPTAPASPNLEERTANDPEEEVSKASAELSNAREEEAVELRRVAPKLGK